MPTENQGPDLLISTFSASLNPRIIEVSSGTSHVGDPTADAGMKI
jgi:hypothetical protein